MRSRENGVAILEAVGVSAVLLTALISAFATSIWISRSYALSHLLDRTLVASSVAPLTIDSRGIQIDYLALENFAETVANQIEQELIHSDIDDDNAVLQPADYLIQVGYAVARFNVHTGKFLTFTGGAPLSPFTYLTIRGQAAPAPEVLVNDAVQGEFEEFAGQGSLPLLTGEALSEEAYMGAVIYLYSRAGLAPYVFSLYGKEAVLVRSKVVSLRGGFEL